MKTGTCDCLLLAHDVTLTPHHEMVGCLREKGHRFDHLSLLPDGTYILWLSEFPFCECEGEDHCGCFGYDRVSLQEAHEILANLEH